MTSAEVSSQSANETGERLLAAVRENQMEILQQLLDSPKWYHVADEDGDNLLQLAIYQGRREIFDYILSLPDFPLDYENDKGETALMVAFIDLDQSIFCDMHIDDYFSYELVKNGVRLDVVSSNGQTPLERALHLGFVRVAKLLIEKGVDLTQRDYVCEALDTYTFFWNGDGEGLTEIIAALVIEGADVSVTHFAKSVDWGNSWERLTQVQEMLMLHTVDEYSVIKTDILFTLADDRSPLVHEILKCPAKVKVRAFHDWECHDYFLKFCSMDLEYLKMLIDKFGREMATIFEGILDHSSDMLLVGYNHISIENLGLILGSVSKLYTIPNFVPSGPQSLYKFTKDESKFAEVLLFLCSYGDSIHETTLQSIYKKIGYCEDFKLLLHMDIVTGTEIYNFNPRFCLKRNALANLIYDPTKSIEQLVRQREYYDNEKQLLHYFRHPELCHLVEVQNEIPRLEELARNACRRFIIDKYDAKTSRRFYTILNKLPIGNAFKKIISYESILY